VRNWEFDRGYSYTKCMSFRSPIPQSINKDLRERVPTYFRLPPMTERILRVYKRITPQFKGVGVDEKSRKFWELEQNASCLGEFEALEVLRDREVSKVLDIGCGLGRSSVFAKRYFNWSGVDFHLYDDDMWDWGKGTKNGKYIGGKKRWAGRMEDRDERSFFSDLSVLQEILAYNGCNTFKVFDAQGFDYGFWGLGKYDVIWSFLAVGFHWDLRQFWGEIENLLNPGGVFIATVRTEFKIFEALESYKARFVKYQCAWPPKKRRKLLIVEN